MNAVITHIPIRLQAEEEPAPESDPANDDESVDVTSADDAEQKVDETEQVDDNVDETENDEGLNHPTASDELHEDADVPAAEADDGAGMKSVNQSIKSSICKAPLKQSSQRRLL